MKYSDKLNGFWEEGYHYYLEFDNEKLTVRGYDRGIRIETTVSYDADRLDSEERTVIDLENNILSRTYEGEMMSEIKELVYENGELKMLYNYIIMGETLYTLTKQDGGPFRHIIIRDDEYIDKLQGKWEKWSSNGKGNNPLVIKNNTVFWAGGGGRFHVVSYTYDRESVYIVPEDLTKSDFGAFTNIRVYPDKLTTTMMVCDMSMPLSVFAREDMLDKIEVPSAAKQSPRNVMMYSPYPPQTPMGMMGIGMMHNVTGSDEIKPEGKRPVYCANCGCKLPENDSKFCQECGSEIIYN